MFDSIAPAPPYSRVVVAIPAKNERAELPGCLAALAAQRDRHGAALDFEGVTVLVLANDCADDTAAQARALAPALPFSLAVLERALPPGLAHAGGARRLTMDAGAALLAASGRSQAVLLCTDADGRAAPGWLTANLAALAAGADAVAGVAVAKPEELARLPAVVRARDERERGYAALLDEIAARVDPELHDPWPRHDTHSGASIALRLGTYRRIGGLPPVPLAEDRALFAALRRADARIRHAPEARVMVSCRLQGRASGGMADTLRNRLADPAAPVDERLEPAARAWFRARCRRALRLHWRGDRRPGDPWRLALALRLPAERLLAIARHPRFGEAWEALQAASPVLRRRVRIAPAALAGESAIAGSIVLTLRALEAATAIGDHRAKRSLYGAPVELVGAR